MSVFGYFISKILGSNEGYINPVFVAVSKSYLNCEYPFKLFAFDNASEDKFEIENTDNPYVIQFINGYSEGPIN